MFLNIEANLSIHIASNMACPVTKNICKDSVAIDSKTLLRLGFGGKQAKFINYPFNFQIILPFEILFI